MKKGTISNVSLGYIWHSDMGFEEFVSRNNLQDERGSAYDIYRKIEIRYIDSKYGR